MQVQFNFGKVVKFHSRSPFTLEPLYHANRVTEHTPKLFPGGFEHNFSIGCLAHNAKMIHHRLPVSQFTLCFNGDEQGFGLGGDFRPQCDGGCNGIR
jgi:hypothetical protein